MREVRRQRDEAKASNAFAGLKKAATSPTETTLPYMLDAVRAYTTEGEIMSTLVDLWASTPRTRSEDAII